MKRRNSVIVAVIVLAIVVAVAVGDYEYSVEQRNAECSQSATNLVGMFGMVSLPTELIGSSLSLTVTDTTCTPIVGITVTSVQPEIAGVVNASFVKFNGVLVSPTSPLPGGHIGTGSVAVTGITAGENYTLTVVISFASGTVSQTETMEMDVPLA